MTDPLKTAALFLLTATSALAQINPSPKTTAPRDSVTQYGSGFSVTPFPMGRYARHPYSYDAVPGTTPDRVAAKAKINPVPADTDKPAPYYEEPFRQFNAQIIHAPSPSGLGLKP